MSGSRLDDVADVITGIWSIASGGGILEKAGWGLDVQ